LKNKLFIVLLLGFSLLSISSQEVSEKEISEKDFPITRDQNAVTPTPGTAPNVPIADYLNVILVLVVLIVILYFVLRFLKKVGGNRTGLDNDQIKVLSTKILKGTTALHLVEVAGQVFLIGATDSNITGIGEITDKEALDSIDLEATSDVGFQAPFLKIFTDKLKNISRNSISEEANDIESNNLKTKREKLEKY